jgi:hypothetical protein
VPSDDCTGYAPRCHGILFYYFYIYFILSADKLSTILVF